MQKILAAAAALVAMNAIADPFLVADVPGLGDKCVFRRGTVDTTSDVVVDTARGNALLAYRVCKVDLAADPKTGIVYLAVRDTTLGKTTTFVSYTFPSPTAPLSPRVEP